jgi:hypothetical protein
MNRLLIVAILIISTLPLCAQGQAPNAAQLKTDAQNVAAPFETSITSRRMPRR